MTLYTEAINAIEKRKIDGLRYEGGPNDFTLTVIKNKVELKVIVKIIKDAITIDASDGQWTEVMVIPELAKKKDDKIVDEERAIFEINRIVGAWLKAVKGRLEKMLKILDVAKKALKEIEFEIDAMEVIDIDTTGFEIILNEYKKQTVLEVKEDPKEQGAFILKVSGKKTPEGFGDTSEGRKHFAAAVKKAVNDWREKLLRQTG